jgi:hypothetical protein
MKKAILVFAVLILTAIAETQAQETSAVMYVNATAGLRVRSSPDLDGERIASLSYMSEVRVTRQGENTVTIDGISGKWVYVTAGDTEGWVFGGYLITPENLKQMFVGTWRVVDESNNENWWFRPFMVLIFKENGDFIYGQDSTGGGFFGTWSFENGAIVTTGRWSDHEWEATETKTVYLRNIQFIDDTNLTLHNGFNEKTERLTTNFGTD